MNVSPLECTAFGAMNETRKLTKEINAKTQKERKRGKIQKKTERH